jgi:hypothetical protein
MENDTNVQEALELHNNSLKGIINQLTCERNALDQTVMELLRANINLKAGCAMLEMKVAELNAKLLPPSTTPPLEPAQE